MIIILKSIQRSSKTDFIQKTEYKWINKYQQHSNNFKLFSLNYYRFTVILTDKNGNPISNTNRIPLSIGIYSSENPPKYIDSNTAGKKIKRGQIHFI